jgi:hypothetical protein
VLSEVLVTSRARETRSLRCEVGVHHDPSRPAGPIGVVQVVTVTPGLRLVPVTLTETLATGKLRRRARLRVGD